MGRGAGTLHPLVCACSVLAVVLAAVCVWLSSLSLYRLDALLRMERANSGSVATLAGLARESLARDERAVEDATLNAAIRECSPALPLSVVGPRIAGLVLLPDGLLGLRLQRGVGAVPPPDSVIQLCGCNVGPDLRVGTHLARTELRVGHVARGSTGDWVLPTDHELPGWFGSALAANATERWCADDARALLYRDALADLAVETSVAASLPRLCTVLLGQAAALASQAKVATLAALLAGRTESPTLLARVCTEWLDHLSAFEGRQAADRAPPGNTLCATAHLLSTSARGTRSLVGSLQAAAC